MDKFLRACFVIFGISFLFSCSYKKNSELIIGSWESIPIQSDGHNDYYITSYFKDSTETISGYEDGQLVNTRRFTYRLINDESAIELTSPEQTGKGVIPIDKLTEDSLIYKMGGFRKDNSNFRVKK